MSRELIRTEKLNQLLDIYRPLLTPYQVEILSLYYADDWSLSEIADSKNVTRNAVFTLIHRVSLKLEMLESQMQLQQRFQQVLKTLENQNISQRVSEEIRSMLFDRKDDSHGI